MRRAQLVSTAVFAVLAAGVALPGLRGGLLAPAALAQNTGDRTVSGTVLDSAEQAVPNATVLLQDRKDQDDPQLYFDRQWALPLCPGQQGQGF